MELAPGFKLSEAGPIPVDWEISRLSDACDTIFDGPHHTPRFVTTGIPFYAGENVVRSSFRYANLIDKKDYRQLCRRATPKRWDTLLVRVGDVGETAFADWDHPYHIYVNLAALRAGALLEAAYLYAYTKYNGFRADLFERSLMHAVPKKINLSELGNVRIAYPKRSEQRAIGSVLFDFDDQVATAEAEILKLTQVKKAATDALLTPTVRLSGYQGEWLTMPISSIARVAKGDQLNRAGLHASDGLPVWNGGTEPSGFTPAYNEEGPVVTISEGGNSCGFVNYVEGRFWCGGHCYTLRPLSDELSPQFLYHRLKSVESDLQALRVGSGLPNVQRERLNEFEVNLPTDPEERCAIATILTDIDAAIGAARAVVAKARDVKAAATDGLLSGRIRLPIR